MILNDRQIDQLGERMISPYSPTINYGGGVSYGLSSFGYDIRLGYEFKTYRRTDKPLDPKRVLEDDLDTVTVEIGDYYVIPPCGFVLAYGLEYIRIPSDTTGLVMDKSTYARCGISLQNTVLEAGWEGQVTLEITNHLERPVILRPGQGIAQILFVTGEPCLVSYATRNGKYMRQHGVTIPRAMEPTT